MLFCCRLDENKQTTNGMFIIICVCATRVGWNKVSETITMASGGEKLLHDKEKAICR